MNMGDRCAFSRDLSHALYPLLPLTAPKLPRYALVGSAMLLCHEHHSAVYHLSAQQHAASAAALIRPQAESVVTAAWCLYVASVEHVEDIHWGRQVFPKPSTMLTQLSKRPELKGKLRTQAAV